MQAGFFHGFISYSFLHQIFLEILQRLIIGVNGIMGNLLVISASCRFFLLCRRSTYKIEYNDFGHGFSVLRLFLPCRLFLLNYHLCYRSQLSRPFSLRGFSPLRLFHWLSLHRSVLTNGCPEKRFYCGRFVFLYSFSYRYGVLFSFAHAQQTV